MVSFRACKPQLYPYSVPGTASLVNVTLNMRYKNGKISNSSSTDSFFFQYQNAPKSVFGRGSAPDPTGGAYDAPPEPLVGWEGDIPSPFPSPSTPSAYRTRRLRRIGSQAPINSNSWLRQCLGRARGYFPVCLLATVQSFIKIG